MTVTLPDEWRARIEARAKLHGYSSVADYFLSLVEDEEKEAEYFARLPGPPELTPRNRGELEAMLDAGLDSGPPLRVTAEFWADMQRRLEERMAKRKGGSA